MGAYKAFKNEYEKIAGQNAGLDYALLKAGMDVLESVKTPEGHIEIEKLEKMGEKPEEHVGNFASSMNSYVQNRLKVDGKSWQGLPEEVKSRLLRTFGLTPSLIKYLVGQVVAKGKLMKFGEVLEGDEQLENIRTAKHEEFISAHEELADSYKKDRLGTVEEALEELNLKELIDPRAVSFEDLLKVLPRYEQPKADKLEEIMKKIDPRLLRSSYK